MDQVVKNLKDRYAVLIANHRAVCTGRSMNEAFVAAQILEKTCHILVVASAMGVPQIINPKEAESLHNEYLNDYSQRAE